jgi:hypothetical protein
VTLVLDEVLAAPEWQMHYGERFALEGILTHVRPSLAVEVGTAEGGSLRRVAAYSQEVHSFDVSPQVADLAEQFPEVTFHIGDSAALLREALAEFAREDRHVDFALVDGDHSAEGVARDAAALLESDACRETVIVFHDTANDDVRAGLEAVGFEAHPKVVLSLLDFVPGYLVSAPIRRFEQWNGLGLVLLGERVGPPIVETERFDSAELLRLARAQLVSEDEALGSRPGAAGTQSLGTRRLWGPALLAGAALGAVARSAWRVFRR